MILGEAWEELDSLKDEEEEEEKLLKQAIALSLEEEEENDKCNVHYKMLNITKDQMNDE